MSAFVWLWSSLVAWMVFDLLLAAWWARRRRRENQVRRDREAYRTAKIRRQFADIVATEYPHIPAQRTEEPS